MALWNDLPMELKILILKHFVDDLLILPHAENSWWQPQYEDFLRERIDNAQRERKREGQPKWTRAQKYRVKDRYRKDYFKVQRTRSILGLHSSLDTFDCGLVKTAIIDLLVAVPEMKTELMNVLERKKCRLAPYYAFRVFDRSDVCRCSAEKCEYVVKLAAWMKR